MKWIVKNIFQVMYWTAFIAYLFTKDIYFGVLQMTCLLAWYFDGRLGKAFNNEVNIITKDDSLLEKINNIEQILESSKPTMIVKGNELLFLKRINRYGDIKELDADERGEVNQNFKLTCLSISEGTYIAHGFNTYIVKLNK